MALGSARLFNINLTQNFNSPYLAISIADFWRRWHITFSRWILDYIFKPLQMQWRNWKNWGTAAALVVAFIISGIWHGASWGFVIWGGLHGLYMACSVFYRPYQKKLHKALGIEKTKLLKLWQIFVTFHLVSFAWIFFRAKSLADALIILKKIISTFSSQELYLTSPIDNILVLMTKFGDNDVGYLVTLLSVILLNRLLHWHDKIQCIPNNSIIIARWSIYLLVIFWIVAFGRFESTSFIYYAF
jgi:D-alanyl-lipoteichoic acid acyltransferase DltB (MBOAT superfamily)